jgi:hypothetical protein
MVKETPAATDVPFLNLLPVVGNPLVLYLCQQTTEAVFLAATDYTDNNANGALCSVI